MKTTKTFLDKQRLLGDHDADHLVENIFLGNSQSELYRFLQLSVSEIEKARKSSPVKEFLLRKQQQPVWFDANRLLRGQQVFETYAAEMMTLLGVLALPYCYAGSPGNKALYLSEKMHQSPGKRLADTAQFIISVSTPGNLTAENIGPVQINKTRLIHAIARYHVQKGNWDMDWGLPINQEDMAGTNLAFSYIILGGLNQSGFVLSDKQKEDFIFLWRYIGYQLGIDEDLLPSSLKEASRLTSVIRQRNFKNSYEGMELTRELLHYYRSIVPSDKAYFVDAQVRYFLGAEISSFIGLESEYFKDMITNFMNSIKEVQNFLFAHESSYGVMIANHRQLVSKLRRGR